MVQIVIYRRNLLLNGAVIAILMCMVGACRKGNDHDFVSFGREMVSIKIEERCLLSIVRSMAEDKVHPLHIFYNIHRHYNARIYDDMKIVIGKQFGNVDSNRLLLTIGISYKSTENWWEKTGNLIELNAAYLLVAKRDKESKGWCFRALPYFDVINMDSMDKVLSLVNDFVRYELGHEAIINPGVTLPADCSIYSQCFWTHPVIWEASDWYCDSCR